MARVADDGDLSREDLQRFRRMDLALEVTGQDGALRYVAVEIAFYAEQSGIDRAVVNAKLLENPEWKAAVRREILTEELLNLQSAEDSTRFVASTEQFIAETTGFIAETIRVHSPANHRVHRGEQRQFTTKNKAAPTKNKASVALRNRLEESVARIDRSIDRLRRDTSNILCSKDTRHN